MAQASAEKLELSELAEKERVASVPQDVRAALAKRKRNKAVCPNHQTVKWERVKVSESRILREREGSEWKHEEKTVPSMKKGCRSRGERGQAKRSPLEK